MAMHRLRVVGFDTSVSEKEAEKNFNAELKKYKQEDWKTSTQRNKNEIGDLDQCLDDNKSPPRRLSKKCLGDNKSQPRTLSKKCLGDNKNPPITLSKKCLGDNKSQPRTLSKKCLGDNKNPPITLSKKCLGDNKCPPRKLSKKCLGDNKSPPRSLSKKILGDKRSLPEKTNIYIGDASRPSGTSVKIYLNDKITTPGTSKMCRPGTSEKFLDDISFTSPPETLKKHSFSFRKSKSEIFKITPKKKSTKRDLKYNSSETSLTKQFQGSTKSPQRKLTLQRNLRKINSRVRHKVENLKENNDVQFLFTRETPSFMRFCRKRAEIERTKTKKKRVFRLPNDIYGFQNNNRAMDQHLYQTSCFKFRDTNKLPLKKFRRGFRRKHKPTQPIAECCCKHHVMRILKSACGNSQSLCYYLNTVHHSRRSQRNDDDQEEEQNPKGLCMAKCETVEVSPSSFGQKATCFCDACTSPSNVEVSGSCHPQPPDVSEASPLPQIATVTSKDSQKPNPRAARAGSAKKKCENDRKQNKNKKNLISNTFKRFRFVKRIVHFHSREDLSRKCSGTSSGKSFIKHICIGLLIVLWSPCLLAGVLVWVVMFPMKFINMSKGKSKRSYPMNRSCKNDPCSEYLQMSFENYSPKKRRSFMSTLTSLCTRTVGVVVNSFNAVISMFKLKSKAPSGVGCLYLPPSYPNPRKRYNLFYVGNRGWVMKPLRRRKIHSVASSRVVQSMRCEIRPKIKCHRKKQHKSPKKVCNECSPHKGKRYPRRRSLLARLPKLLSRRCGCLKEQGSKGRQQRYSAGDRRKRTAEGGVQQPHPEFNCPGYNGPRKQSALIPGLNRNPPISNPYDTDSCRPLPKKQLPKEKKILKEKKRKRNIKEGTDRNRGFFWCVINAVKQAEEKAWPTNFTCQPMWLHTLKQRPCFWIYKSYPRAYPIVLAIIKSFHIIRRLFAYFLTLCFWSPLILCFYFCCNVLCRTSA